MFYCFIKEDLKTIDKKNPLFLQFEYAKKIGKCCICDLHTSSIRDLDNQELPITNEKIFLRTTYDNMRRGISVLEQLDYKLVENERDIDFIEEWYQLGLSTRKILKINLEEFLEMEITGEVENFLKTYKKIFIKSETKGFCAIVHGEKILQKDAKLVGFLKEKCNLYGNKLLMTNFFEIKEDSLGKRESRHVVLNGKLINSSRRIHSLKHCVPKSHLDKAKEIINKVSKIENYPQNYVLDIGDFVINGEVVVDIVELNPISCSMCYVNNSVFEKELPEIEFIKKKLMIGNEYCYDALKNPNYYFEIRKSNKCYSYITEEMYELL